MRGDGQSTLVSIALKEKLIERIFFVSALSSIGIVFLIVLYVLFMGFPIIQDWFLHGFGMYWNPVGDAFGLIPSIFSTLYVGIGATAIATLIGLPCAVYLAEFANQKVRNVIKPSLEVLTGLPSVVMGLIGVIVIVGMIERAYNVFNGTGVLAAWLLLGVMTIPHIASISEDSIRAVPHDLKEASLALGATRWQTTLRVLLPVARPGIVAALLLGMGNAIGETMAVIFVIGNYSAPPIDLFAIVSPSNVMTSMIAQNPPFISDAGASLTTQGGFAVAFILFLMTAILNIAIRAVMKRGGGK
jgi:phosphate ABC transporter permease protein PstC